MTIVMFIGILLLLVLVVALHRIVYRLSANLSERLARIEEALGAEDWVEFPRSVPDSDPEEPERKGIVGRLERIEAALDPMARARQDVRRRMREADQELKADPASSYDHWQVTKIEGLVQKGERPDRKDWESWIGTPYPWADA